MWCQVQATSAISGHGCPLVRSKHAMCSANDGRIYLYGGKSLLNQTLRDLWRFDPDTNHWQQLNTIIRNDEMCKSTNGCSSTTSSSSSTTVVSASQMCRSTEWPNKNHQSSCWDAINDFPPPLQEHTILNYQDKLYVFGGEIGYSCDETPLWIFDLETYVWKKFSINSGHHIMNIAIARPLGRRGHSAVVYQNIMCIYGGYQDIKGSTSEIWTFNLDTEEWYLEGTNFKKDSAPLPRHGHSAIVYKESMYIYGGMSNLNVRNDFWSWNFKTKEWNRVKTNRTNPGVRSFHSAIVVLDSMFIYGGERSNGNHTNELWRYRFANQTWEHIEIKGIAPSCRTRHVAIANPFLKELENNVHHGDQWQHWTCKKQNNSTIVETTFAESTESVDNVKSISMCFSSAEKSPSNFPFIDSNETKTEVNIDSYILDDNMLEKQLNFSTNQQNTNNTEILNQENNPNILNNILVKQDETNFVTKTTAVKMRPRRPLLQKQRPYSDFYGTAISSQKDDFDFNELNETQFKRRSVQESMSYYSLCFSTPPSHLRQKPSPSFALSIAAAPIQTINAMIKDVTPPEALMDKFDSKSDEPDSNINATNQITIKRRENFISKRRLRKNDLGLLDLSSLEMRIPPKDLGYSTAYSLTLDISPDYEKELKFSSNSSPSNEPNSISTEHSEYECMEMTHLDMLEDYLEPEEMLEIVTESTSGEEISPSLNIKTIKKTPAIRRKNYNNNNKNNEKSSSNDNSNKVKVQHQSSATSVSNSSSGYQSLISADSNVNSFDINSIPSISNSSSFGEQNEKKVNDFDHLTAQKLVSKLNDSFHEDQFKNESIELKQIEKSNKDDNRIMMKIQENGKSRSNHMNRLSNWEPNIKEVIEEVNIPGSPSALNLDLSFLHDPDNDNNNLKILDHDNVQNLNDETFLTYRERERSLREEKTIIDLDRQHPIFCMYVFGGKEDCITGVLNKQSMTIWKYYT
ncbi:hypothetical protein DERP_008654 [Dermatophagoides pteronyssinus]|uniref:Uncharacterized protein n=1 Tax=Dermatophagoides pteronyssinus TaxID=6956 RepID=A0ABQ8IWW4_DERPT|nr:hypothetical protein DERP_008654 [Dermatophagoides pteronyssinus]